MRSARARYRAMLAGPSDPDAPGGDNHHPGQVTLRPDACQRPHRPLEGQAQAPRAIGRLRGRQQVPGRGRRPRSSSVAPSDDEKPGRNVRKFLACEWRRSARWFPIFARQARPSTGRPIVRPHHFAYSGPTKESTRGSPLPRRTSTREAGRVYLGAAITQRNDRVPPRHSQPSQVVTNYPALTQRACLGSAARPCRNVERSPA